jgi:release factor H-coupled RctB family protein
MTKLTTQETSELPDHASLFASNDVWMEGSAIQQLARVARYPNCRCAVGMPDLHAGRGIPIGAAFAFEDHVHPPLIGSDAGCGALVIWMAPDRISHDQLERRVRSCLEEEPLAGADPHQLMQALWTSGIRGLGDVEGVDEQLARLAQDWEQGPENTTDLGTLPDEWERFAPALGTVGGGNHFVEISQVDTITNKSLAQDIKLKRGGMVVVAHSGSRGLGGSMAERWLEGPLVGEQREQYLREHEGACRFAQVNRWLLAYRMLVALKTARASKILGHFDVIHNKVGLETVKGESLWVHRKGVTPAFPEQLTVVLGSRGSASWLMQGQENSEGLHSVAHGAGRKMGRGEALSKLKNKYQKHQLTRTKLGSRVICNQVELLYEEHPDAYKNIDSVVQSLQHSGLAEPVASLTPMITVKQNLDTRIDLFAWEPVLLKGVSGGSALLYSSKAFRIHLTNRQVTTGTRHQTPHRCRNNLTSKHMEGGLSFALRLEAERLRCFSWTACRLSAGLPLRNAMLPQEHRPVKFTRTTVLPRLYHTRESFRHW